MNDRTPTDITDKYFKVITHALNSACKELVLFRNTDNAGKIVTYEDIRWEFI
jgi:hypothetical protein